MVSKARLLFAVSALFLVTSCYTVTTGARAPNERWPVLVVHNHTAGSVKVMDQEGRYLGRAMSATDTVVLRYLPYGHEQLRLKITGDRTEYWTPPEHIWARRCWQVEIWPMDPRLDIARTFLPCGLGEHEAGTPIDLLYEPDDPEGRGGVWIWRAIQFYPTPQHRTLYDGVAACLGVPSNFDEVRWYVAEQMFSEDLITFPLGLASRGEKKIYLQQMYLWDETTITHEALHILSNLSDQEMPWEMRAQCEIGHDLRVTK